MTRASAFISWDGVALTAGESGEGRALGLDPACLVGSPVSGAYAHVCASGGDGAQIPYDQPEVQQVRRDALAWWIPLFGDDFVCVSMLTVDEVHTAGAITVARRPDLFASDPFARLFPGTTVRVDFFAEVAPPAGPVVERYAGAPWPAAGF